MMFSPLFPVPPEIFTANVSYLDFDAGEVLKPRPGVKVRTTRLNHPDRATGYRVEFGGKSICYLTDTQHVIGKPDQNVLNIIKGADMVIYDSTYTDAEFPKRADWGHSTWEEGVRLCEAAGVKTFVVFHHDPDHDDDFMDKVTFEVTAKRPGSIVAKEGLVLQP
jgi:phosphoribosyl 1,2-cyclic phosphodiesterase